MTQEKLIYIRMQRMRKPKVGRSPLGAPPPSPLRMSVSITSVQKEERATCLNSGLKKEIKVTFSEKTVSQSLLESCHRW